MFIVVLVITMLTAIGLFAAHAATLSTIASGHQRQMTQTHYLAEYGLSLAIAWLEDKGGANVTMVQAVRPTSGDWRCSAPPAVMPDPPPYCFVIMPQTIEGEVAEELLEPPTADAPGSMGRAQVGWNFKTELTDIYQMADAAGSDLTSPDRVVSKSCMVTVNTRSIVWPTAVGAQDEATATAGSQEALSAHITLPCSVQ